MPTEQVQQRLPRGLRVDTFDGWAWLGVVPFLMDHVRFRTVGEHSVEVPTASAFPELNLRTYVIAPDGRPGVYFFSLDADSLLAVVGARVAFGLPYFWSDMRVTRQGEMIQYLSRRRHGTPADFATRYRSLVKPYEEDDLTSFLTRRHAFFARYFGAVQAGEINHGPWSLEHAEAEFAVNGLPGAFGFTLPDRAPLLHFSRELHMHAWTIRPVRTPRVV